MKYFMKNIPCNPINPYIFQVTNKLPFKAFVLQIDSRGKPK